MDGTLHFFQGLLEIVLKTAVRFCAKKENDARSGKEKHNKLSHYGVATRNERVNLLYTNKHHCFFSQMLPPLHYKHRDRRQNLVCTNNFFKDSAIENIFTDIGSPWSYFQPIFPEVILCERKYQQSSLFMCLDDQSYTGKTKYTIF